MLSIYGMPTFNTNKVLITAEELGLNYRYIPMNVKQGEHKKPDHLERHPLGKLPAIVDDGFILYESNSICRYLVEKEESSLYGGTIRDKSRINQWIDLMSQHLGRWMSAIYYEEYVKTKFLGKEPDRRAVDEALSFLSQQLPVLEHQLKNKAFIVKSYITIADIIAFSYAHIQEVTSLNFDEFPAIEGWYERFRARDSVEKALGRYV